MVELNPKQQLALDKIDEFIESDEKIFYLFGCAGSGKTYIMSMKIIDLILKNQMDHIFVCAPTHQALNVIESYIKSNFSENEKIDLITKITFMTIHKLLEYRPIIMAKSGTKVFKSTRESKYMKNMQKTLILLDESSMISHDMYSEIKKYLDLYPIKFIFMGDSSQLPPVGETESPVFLISNSYKFYVMLNQVMRTKSEDIKTVCEIIRKWDQKESLCKKLLPIHTNKSKTFKLYHKKKDYLNATWFTNYIKKLNSGDLPIILTWKNVTADYYNSIIRQYIHSKSNLKNYEVGDHAIFNNYYSSGDGCSFYTSDMIKILKIKKDKKKLFDWTTIIIPEPKNSSEKEFNALIKKLAKQNWTFEVDIFTVERIQSEMTNITKGKTYSVQTINRAELINYNNLLDHTKEHIQFFFKNIKSEVLTNRLWAHLHNFIIDPYAEIKFGYSITTHKAQGSTFNMVIVDFDDLKENPIIDEFQKALYTAAGRAANELSMLL